VIQGNTLDPAQAQALPHIEALLSFAPFDFAFLDRDLRFLRINEQFAQINGKSVEARLGKPVADIVPALETSLRKVAARIIATGQPVRDHEFTEPLARALGMPRTWNESWYPVRDDRAEIIGFSVMVVEITERKHAEAALRLTNDRFELAVKASQAMLWQQDLELRFTWLHNPAPGIDGSDAVGKKEADLLERAQDVAVVEALKHEVIRSGVGQRKEFFPQIQGVEHCFELLMEPLRDAGGRITGLTGAAMDITERKRVELNLVKAIAAAEDANQAKSNFLASMSHELRTPLNSILGFAQLLESGTPVPTPAQRKNLEHILKSGWFLLELVDELLDLALIESGKLCLTQEAVSLTDVMQECRAMMERQAGERGIRIIFAALEHPGHALADRTRVKQVVINLLSNAIKYNKAHGTVSVECALVAPDAMRISVRDTGEGLAPEKLAQLYQPFNRLGREAGPHHGTGGDEQAPCRTDGWVHRRGQHARCGQRFLV
jgi:PAS domain S-box-containing protein